MTPASTHTPTGPHRDVDEPRTVVLIDNDESSRALLRQALGELPWKLVEVAGPAAAIHAVHRNAHFGTIVIARYEPYTEDSKRLAHRLAAFSRSSNYLIFLLDRRSMWSVSAAFSAGADDVIVEPTSEVELRARLEHASRFLELESVYEQIGDNRALIAEMSTATVVHSRNYLESELAKEVERSLRYGHPLGVILIEASLAYGPAEGALRASGRYLLELVRKDIDWVARYTKRCFAMVLPETGVQNAFSTARRLADRFDATDLEAAGIPEGTSWSFGVSAFDKVFGPDPPRAETLLDRAEEYLAAARLKGDNKVAGGTAALRANTHIPSP
jgi:diguanylate cyclase (GGDEF)-like protein